MWLATLALLPLVGAQCVCCGPLGENVGDICDDIQSAVGPMQCDKWVEAVNNDCMFDCTNCTKMVETFSSNCMLEVAAALGDVVKAESECGGPITQLKAVCDDKCAERDAFCFKDNGPFCMQHCGTYIPCTCYRPQGSFQYICKGEVVSDKNGESCYDLVDTNNPEILELCYKVTSPCFQYRTCPIDYCALRNVTCPPLNQCYQQGTCDPDTAKCWWNAKPDGIVCDDGDEFTIDDVCMKGICTGATDYCAKHSVVCKAPNPCMPDGVCWPATGDCLYTPMDNGVQCNDGLAYTANDTCVDGLCVGEEIDLCPTDCPAGLNAGDGECIFAYECEATRGECVAKHLRDDTVCGGEPYEPTHGVCINGACVPLNPAKQFQKKKTLDDIPGFSELRAFHKDEPTVEACQHACKQDATCLAIGYSHTTMVCSVFGRHRVSPPPGHRCGEGGPCSGWVELLMNDPKLRGDYYLRVRVATPEEETISLTDIFIGPVGITLLLMALAIWRILWRSWKARRQRARERRQRAAKKYAMKDGSPKKKKLKTGKTVELGAVTDAAAPALPGQAEEERATTPVEAVDWQPPEAVTPRG